MQSKILRLGKETAIYGLSTVIGRLLNFLIVPFYANVLTTAENGIQANIYAYIAFAYVIFCYGMEPAYMRFVSSLELGDKKQNFSVPFLSLLATSVFLIGLKSTHHILIRYAGWIMCLDSLSIIPFASLRMEHRAKQFVSLRICNILMTLILNLVFILIFDMHLEGVFLANMLSSGFIFLLMMFFMLRQLTFRFPAGLYKEVLKFGLPYIPAMLASQVLQVIDRPIVKALINDDTLGIYTNNYKLGIFMMLIVGMFDFAWRPFFLNHAKDADAKQLFSKVFTYFFIGAMSVFLVISLFIEDIVRIGFFGRHFFPSVYWQGVQIVPWVLLAYVFNGAYIVFIVGLYPQKKTKFLPFITGAGALVNIGANFLLIPKIGILGAALATLFSYIVMAVFMYFVSQRFYKVDYEWSKVIKIAGLAALFFLIFRLSNLQPLNAIGIFVKFVLIIGFAAGLVLLKVVDTKEIADLKTVFRRLLGR